MQTTLSPLTYSTPTIEQLWKSLDHVKYVDELYEALLVLADAHEEEGRSTEAEVLRWIVRTKRVPANGYWNSSRGQIDPSSCVPDVIVGHTAKIVEDVYSLPYTAAYRRLLYGSMQEPESVRIWEEFARCLADREKVR